jgi:hypothetical protein
VVGQGNFGRADHDALGQALDAEGKSAPFKLVGRRYALMCVGTLCRAYLCCVPKITRCKNEPRHGLNEALKHRHRKRAAPYRSPNGRFKTPQI